MKTDSENDYAMEQFGSMVTCPNCGMEFMGIGREVFCSGTCRFDSSLACEHGRSNRRCIKCNPREKGA